MGPSDRLGAAGKCGRATQLFSSPPPPVIHFRPHRRLAIRGSPSPHSSTSAASPGSSSDGTLGHRCATHRIHQRNHRIPHNNTSTDAMRLLQPASHAAVLRRRGCGFQKESPETSLRNVLLIPNGKN